MPERAQSKRTWQFTNWVILTGVGLAAIASGMIFTTLGMASAFASEQKPEAAAIADHISCALILAALGIGFLTFSFVGAIFTAVARRTRRR